jgi:hypothetical protein
MAPRLPKNHTSLFARLAASYLSFLLSLVDFFGTDTTLGLLAFESWKCSFHNFDLLAVSLRLAA